MLAVARRRGDVEWVAGTAASMAFDREFDLVVMTGHAFQVLVGDEELRASLTAIRRALADGGRFGFETRNPLARAWERWNPVNATDVVDPVEARYGGWSLEPPDPASPEIVTLARGAARPPGEQARTFTGLSP